SILRVERAWQVARGQRHQTYPRPALPPDDAGQNRAISSLDEKPDPAGQLLPARTARTEHRGVRQVLQQLSIPREPGQPDAGPTSTSGAARPFSNGGKRSNEKPSSKDAACISRQSQPEPSNQMSQTFS